jgi:hypothetical protein
MLPRLLCFTGAARVLGAISAVRAKIFVMTKM